jgi:DNA-binding PadR family transcriptional regulator
MGLLSSRWEDAMVAAEQNRPRRRFYSLTAAGDEAVTEAARNAAETRAKKGWASA